MFGAALLAIGKKKTTDQKGGKAEAKGRDADNDANKKTTSRAMKVRQSSRILVGGESTNKICLNMFQILNNDVDDVSK